MVFQTAFHRSHNLRFPNFFSISTFGFQIEMGSGLVFEFHFRFDFANAVVRSVPIWHSRVGFVGLWKRDTRDELQASIHQLV